jgi:hypothetical protein
VPTGYYLLDHRTKPDNWYSKRRTPLRVIVIHITASLEDLDAADASAERTARYAATTDRKVSWHSGSDSDSFLRLLPAEFTAWHVEGFNSETYGHEISKATTKWAGMPSAWVDRTLANAAACLRPVAARHKIPLRLLTREQVQAGAYGFAAHSTLDPARRTDPGRDFPWSRLFALMEDDVTPQQMQELKDEVWKAVRGHVDFAFDQHLPPRLDAALDRALAPIRAQLPADGEPLAAEVDRLRRSVRAIAEKVCAQIEDGA